MAVVKKSISYETPDGVPVTKEYYFQLGKADVLEMDVVHDYPDIEDYLAALFKDPKNHTREIIDVWKQMLFHSVGERKGDLLIKGPEVIERFRYSGAFEELLSQLLDEDDAGASFFTSIMPADTQEKIASTQREYSKEELLGMTDEEFARVAGTKKKGMSKKYLVIYMQRKEAARARQGLPVKKQKGDQAA